MECNYQAVGNNVIRKSDRGDYKYLLRQAHINSGVWTIFYMAGLSCGAPTVLIPQLRKSNVIIDDELASWLYSASNITAIPWVLILPLFSRWSGRKPVYILSCLAGSASFILLYSSTTPNEILIAGVVQGLVNASNISIMTLIQNEYSSPKYRGFFATITSTSFFLGIWTSNAIGIYFYWKYIAIVGMICSAYTFTITFYPESPVWLASKGKFKKSEEAFKWLNGVSEQSDKELHELIKSQKDYKNNIVDNKNYESLIAIVRKKEFYKPVLLAILVSLQYNFSGKLICSSYAIEVLSKITNSEEAAHTAMLTLDGVTILGMYFGTILSKILKRRTLYFPSSFMGVAFLLIISLYLYLVKLSVLVDNNVIIIFLLVAYSLSMSCGAVVMCVALYSEIIPVRYQAIGSTLISLCFIGFTSLLLKLTPTAFKHLGIHGSFLFCGLTCGILTFILYLYLPETKGKTLLEIEEYFKGESVKCKANEVLKDAAELKIQL